jgi:uncharacterized protein with FMN-binding domain
VKRLAVWIVSTASGVVLLFSYSTSTSGAGGGRVVSGAAPVGVVPAAPASPSATSPSATSPSAAPPSPAPTTRTVNGSAVDTRFGPVQVQIKVTGSRIVSADAITYPTDSRRDREINGYAIPQLDQETLQAQGAQIDTVSGATYTSEGYQQSLQSAIDAAHL